MSMTYDDIAQRFYGSAAGQGGATPAPAPRGAPAAPQRDVQDILYGTAPQVDLESLQNIAQIPGELRAEGTAKFRAALGDLGIDTLGASVIATRLADYLSHERTEAERFALREATRNALRPKYRDDYEVELAAVNRALDKYPHIRDLLVQSGAGSDADVVEALIEGVRRVKARGG